MSCVTGKHALNRKQQWLKKTGQFSYVMAVELVHIFGELSLSCNIIHKGRDKSEI